MIFTSSASSKLTFSNLDHKALQAFHIWSASCGGQVCFFPLALMTGYNEEAATGLTLRLFGRFRHATIP